MKRASTALGFAVLLGSTGAGAAPRGTYRWVTPLAGGDDLAPAQHSSNTIYLDRCEGGCVLTPGDEDSRTNRSSILWSTSEVSEFAHSDADWDYIVRCVAEIYEPFDIEITDVDPGNAPHFKAIVAGYPEEIGEEDGVGGVAPYSCGVINNAITYSFANIYYDPQDICNTVAQETAHAFGLDHEFLCADPMTYLSNCSNDKHFQDVDARCGEFSARNCSCGGARQNSYQELMTHFGASTPTPPTVAFVRPADGAMVSPSFPIEIEADDNIAIDRVELYINGEKVDDKERRPFIFNAPADVPGGPVEVEVRAYDNQDAVATATIDVIQGDPCTADSCEGDLVCVAGNCVDGPSEPGGLGGECEDSADCATGACGEADGEKRCVVECGEGCPDGFRCRGEDGPNPVCWPDDSGSGGCASAAADAGSPPWSIGLLTGLGMLLVLTRRRPRSAAGRRT